MSQRESHRGRKVLWVISSAQILKSQMARSAIRYFASRILPTFSKVPDVTALLAQSLRGLGFQLGCESITGSHSSLSARLKKPLRLAVLPTGRKERADEHCFTR